jgi:hypothetical protein
MNDQIFVDMAVLQQLERIANALEKLARGNAPEEPNLVRPIEEYRRFDWASIGASVVRQDSDGPTHLEYGGFVWSRRSPQNKFDGAIWYSRSAGKDTEGNVLYLRLITFREIKDVDPLPAKLARTLTAAPEAAAPVKNAQPAQPAEMPAEKSNEATSAQPVKTPAAKKTPAGNGRLAREDYLKQAVSKKFNLSAQAAEAVAQIAGIPDDGKDPRADYAPAMKLVPYFAECKALGIVKFTEARDILQKHQGDIEQALFDVRDSRQEA